MLKSLQEILRGDVEHALLHLWSERLSEANAAAAAHRMPGSDACFCPKRTSAT